MVSVAIGCQDCSHEGRLVKVDQFVYDRQARWCLAARTRRTPDGGHVGRAHAEDAEWSLDADDNVLPTDEKHVPNAVLDQVERTVYRLRCKLCGLSVSVRSERLHPVLSDYATRGVFYVELASLARIVS